MKQLLVISFLVGGALFAIDNETYPERVDQFIQEYEGATSHTNAEKTAGMTLANEGLSGLNSFLENPTQQNFQVVTAFAHLISASPTPLTASDLKVGNQIASIFSNPRYAAFQSSLELNLYVNNIVQRTPADLLKNYPHLQSYYKASNPGNIPPPLLDDFKRPLP